MCLAALLWVVGCGQEPDDSGQTTTTVDTVSTDQQFKVKIEYCTGWGYKAKANSLSAKIEKKYGVKPVLVKSSGGAFEIYKDDKKVYSKLQTKKFPDFDEVLKLLGN